MWSEDITGSEAYAKALQKTGILSEKETKEICEGLEKVRAEWAAGEFKVVVSLRVKGGGCVRFCVCWFSLSLSIVFGWPSCVPLCLSVVRRSPPSTAVLVRVGRSN